MSVISVQFPLNAITDSYMFYVVAETTEFLFVSDSDIDLIQRHLGSNPKRRLDVSYPYSKFGVNRPKQTEVIEQKRNFYYFIV